MRTKFPGAAIVVLLATAAAPACAVVDADFKYTEREEKRFTTGGKPQVTVSTFDGAIEIRPWDRNEVLVVVEKRGSNKEDVQPIAVRASQDGDRVTVDVTSTHDRNVFFGFVGRSAKLIVSLPAASEVTAKSGDGSIDVESVAGTVDLRSGDGSIHARALTGDVTATTGDGSIDVSGKLTALRAHSGDGSVHIHADQGSAPSADWDITTGDGSVTLEIPDNFSGELDAHTGDGGIHMDGVAVSDTPNGERDRQSRRRNSVRGRIGSGGKSIRIRTGDGSITLRRS
ncbi:MAG TPA: DUF4097 family beta strand repeat-containing protein [Vicinamibacterales bacterium]|nr:DUF4097 family beta strand repeat-containing protein [Vicinamibacterales bacterium]